MKISNLIHYLNATSYGWFKISGNWGRNVLKRTMSHCDVIVTSSIRWKKEKTHPQCFCVCSPTKIVSAPTNMNNNNDNNKTDGSIFTTLYLYTQLSVSPVSNWINKREWRKIILLNYSWSKRKKQEKHLFLHEAFEILRN